MADSSTSSTPRLTDPLPHPGPQRDASGTPDPHADHADLDLFQRDRGAAGNLLEALYSENPYRLNFWAAVGYGILATVVFTAFWYPLYFSYGNASLDLCLLLGSIVSPNEMGHGPGWVARVIGIGLHLGVGVGLALTYAIILLVLKQQSNAGKATLFGVMVGTGMMAFALPFFVGLLARFHPVHLSFEMPDVALNQVGTGNVGWGPMTVALLAHAAYGYVLGSFYRNKVAYDTVSDPNAPEGFNPAAGGVVHAAH